MMSVFPNIQVFAETGYKQLYIDYFKENPQKMNGLTGYMLTELNGDGVPELFTVYHSSFDPHISGIVYDRMYAIENGKIVEHTTHYSGGAMYSKYLPDTEVDTETFISVFTDKADNRKKLISYSVDYQNRGKYRFLSYDGHQLTISEADYTDTFMDGFNETDEPICSALYQSIGFKISLKDALIMLFEKYEKLGEKEEKVELTPVKADKTSYKEPKFDDIKSVDEYTGYIFGLGYLNLFKGDENGNFNPESTITRAEFSTIVCRMLGYENDASKYKGKTVFNDVASSHWASGYIFVASQLGIINGYGNGNFGPQDPVTYEQAIKMLICAVEYDKTDICISAGVECPDGIIPYPDGYMAIAEKYNLADSLCKTGDNALRKVIAKLLYTAISFDGVNDKEDGKETISFDFNKSIIKKIFGFENKEDLDSVLPELLKELEKENVPPSDKKDLVGKEELQETIEEIAEENYVAKNSIEYNGHTYYLFDKELTWQEAKEYCEKIGGYLATFTSEDEWSIVHEEIKNSGFNCWLGGYGKGAIDTWAWITREEWTYFDWCSGEPNNDYGGTENYLGTYRSSYQWNDYRPETKLGFVCEFGDVDITLSPVATTDWNGHTYRVYDESMTWEEAKQYCENSGGHLVTITSEDEQETVVSLLNYGANKNGYWMGGYTETDRIWKWITGEKFSYSNWDEDEPNNYRSRENVIMLINAEDDTPTKWNDMADFGDPGYGYDVKNMGFICEWDYNADETLLPIATTDWNGHTYHLYDVSMTWNEAKQYCENSGGHLVTITSEEEQKMIENLIVKGNKYQYWLGMSTSSGNSTWVTGESVSYTKWDGVEPNHCSRSDGEYEQYIQIYSNKVLSGNRHFRWNDNFIDNTFPGDEKNFSQHTIGFICEFERTISNHKNVNTTDFIINNRPAIQSMLSKCSYEIWYDFLLDDLTENSVNVLGKVINFQNARYNVIELYSNNNYLKNLLNGGQDRYTAVLTDALITNVFVENLENQLSSESADALIATYDSWLGILEDLMVDGHSELGLNAEFVAKMNSSLIDMRQELNRLKSKKHNYIKEHSGNILTEVDEYYSELRQFQTKIKNSEENIRLQSFKKNYYEKVLADNKAKKLFKNISIASDVLNVASAGVEQYVTVLALKNARDKYIGGLEIVKNRTSNELLKTSISDVISTMDAQFVEVAKEVLAKSAEKFILNSNFIDDIAMKVVEKAGVKLMTKLGIAGPVAAENVTKALGTAGTVLAVVNASFCLAELIGGTSTEAKAAIDLRILIEIEQEMQKIDQDYLLKIINGQNFIESYVQTAEVIKPIMAYGSYLTNMIYTAEDKSLWNVVKDWTLQKGEEYNDFNRIYQDEIKLINDINFVY